MRVWVNGTFDVLHVGHVSLLQFASLFGKVRVGIDTDRRVKELKGDDRPVNNWNDRCLMLKELRSVKEVVGFDSDEELEKQIKTFEPDYCVIGSDYKDKKVIGSQYCKKLVFFDKIDGYSTTKILSHG
jgi:D-beta-D-heptose 7-phosphate kinase/D-beta-D-heptose 1-phosphate adenosyltransferase